MLNLDPLAPYKTYFIVVAFFVVFAGVFAFGGFLGWRINGWRLEGEIAEIKAAHAGERAAMASAVAAEMATNAAKINEAALEFTATQTELSGRLDLLRKDLKNAPRLPVDCKPGEVRINALRSAVNAANGK